MTTSVAIAAPALTWFEIPCLDIDRAERFYNTVLDTDLIDYPDDEPMRIFPAAPGASTGALVVRPPMKPGIAGTLVYLRCDADLDAAMGRVAAAGGKLLVRKTAVPGGDRGHYCVVRDTEGNHIGLHQLPAAS